MVQLYKGLLYFIPAVFSSLSVDSLDPEKLLQCPYDKNHHIRACRFPYHLIKCRKNHPDVANKLATCPFNARHQVPRAEISHHISSCDDKSCIEQDVVNQTRNLGQETLAESTWQCPPCDEDWDKGEVPPHLPIYHVCAPSHFLKTEGLFSFFMNIPCCLEMSLFLLGPQSEHICIAV
uniref:Gametocyte specific factor 1 n=1 Tax=Oryctolagus cuniculus TaxID=9986 RepID=A0A5F9C511_RABIT